MSRPYDYTVGGVIIIISAVMHRLGVEIFAPESPLHSIASQGAAMNGASRADLWFEILAIWMPLLGVGFAFAFMLMREYRRQVSTAAQRP
jgi:hypothetical protein